MRYVLAVLALGVLAWAGWDAWVWLSTWLLWQFLEILIRGL